MSDISSWQEGALFPLAMALTEVIIQSILGQKRIQISNSSYLSNPLQPVCSSALVQESPGVMDRGGAGKDDPTPEKQGRETGVGVGAQSH